MKKILTLALFGLFAINSASFAQDESDKPKPNFWWGPKVGVDLFTPTVDQAAIESQIKSNYQAGLFFRFGRKFFIQPEAYYATQKEEYETAAGVEEISIDRIKIPVMLGMKLVNLGLFSTHLQAGPSASFLISDLEDGNTRKGNFALQGGGGVDVLGFLTLDVRYSVDLSEDTQAQIEQLDWDSGVNVTLGIKLR